MPDKAFFTSLPNRGLVTVAGPEARDFLQGLITNDIALLDSQPSIYACLLNAQGKFLHDFFITRAGDSYLLDCEGGARAEDLMKRLGMYRLRAQVEISCAPEQTVYAVFLAQAGWPDPRNSSLGWRSFDRPNGLEERAFEEWDRLRISLCVPDGSRDLIPGQSTMDEARMDMLNAVDYNKGCYVGQELTARMHYRGLGKKHLYAVKIESQNPRISESQSSEILGFGDSEILLPNGQNIGEMRSSCGDIGLALLKDGEIDRLAEAGLRILE